MVRRNKQKRRIPTAQQNDISKPMRKGRERPKDDRNEDNATSAEQTSQFTDENQVKAEGPSNEPKCTQAAIPAQASQASQIKPKRPNTRTISGLERARMAQDCEKQYIDRLLRKDKRSNSEDEHRVPPLLFPPASWEPGRDCWPHVGGVPETIKKFEANVTELRRYMRWHLDRSEVLIRDHRSWTPILNSLCKQAQEAAAKETQAMRKDLKYIDSCLPDNLRNTLVWPSDAFGPMARHQLHELMTD